MNDPQALYRREKVLAKFFAWALHNDFEKIDDGNWKKDGIIHTSPQLFNKWFFHHYAQQKCRIYIITGIVLSVSQAVLIVFEVMLGRYLLTAFGSVILIFCIILIVKVRKSMIKWREMKI